MLASMILSVVLFPQNDVAASAAETKPIKVNVEVPDADLMNLDGKIVSMKKILGGVPTVLVFYRGGWCPYCNTQLAELGRIQGELKELGYQIVAISPDVPAELKKSTDKNKVDYRLFSDSKADAIRKFGLAFRVDDATFKIYKEKYNIDIERASGQTHHILPVPAVILVDKSGKTKFVFTDPDYRVRLKSEDLLAAARKT